MHDAMLLWGVGFAVTLLALATEAPAAEDGAPVAPVVADALTSPPAGSVTFSGRLGEALATCRQGRLYGQRVGDLVAPFAMPASRGHGSRATRCGSRWILPCGAGWPQLAGAQAQARSFGQSGASGPRAIGPPAEDPAPPSAMPRQAAGPKHWGVLWTNRFRQWAVE